MSNRKVGRVKVAENACMPRKQAEEKLDQKPLPLQVFASSSMYAKDCSKARSRMIPRREITHLEQLGVSKSMRISRFAVDFRKDASSKGVITQRAESLSRIVLSIAWKNSAMIPPAASSPEIKYFCRGRTDRPG